MNKLDLLNGFKKTKTKIEALDKEITIREMSYRGMVEFARAVTTADKAVAAVIYGVCDETGELMFTDQDCNLIANSMSYEAIQEIASHVMKLTSKPESVVKQHAN